MGTVNHKESDHPATQSPSHPVTPSPPRPLAPSQPHWFVLYTKSRSEKKVADGLRKKGIEVFCPMLKTQRKWSDRLKWVEEPLFRSYCFVRLQEKQRALVFDVPGVVRYLFWLGKPAIVKDEEIEVLQEMLDSHDHDKILLRELNVNDRIRIKEGPFQLLEGEIIEKRGPKLQVYMEALQVMVYVDLRSSDVERVGR